MSVFTIPAVTEEKLAEVYQRIGINKAPDLDVAHKKLFKLAIKVNLEWLEDAW